jgi:lipoprotein-releasing system permease protein
VGYYAWKQLWPSGSSGRWFAPFAIFGVALGVAVLLVVLAIMDGFQGEIRRRLLRFHGEVAVISDGGAFSPENGVLDRLASLEGVEAAVPFYETFLLLEKESRYAFPLARGSDGGESGGNGEVIFLGRSIAEQLAARPGDEVLALSPRQVVANLSGDGERHLPLQLASGGPTAGRREGPDGSRVFLPLELLAEMSGEPGKIHGFELRLRRGVDAENFARRLNGGILPPSLRAVTWMESNRELLSALALERAAMFFSMAFIVVIAAFSMACSLSSHVAGKVREIGLLMALGCGRGAIAASFLLQSALVGFFGILVGLGLGAFLLSVRDGILRGVLWFFGRGERIFEYYDFIHLPAAIGGGVPVKICAFAMATTLLAGLLPACRVLRLDPSAALRHGY